jgi:DNA-binding LytR/AlgR family response regulator
VNADFIKAARSLLNGDYILELKNGLELRASRTYRQQLMQVLKRA